MAKTAVVPSAQSGFVEQVKSLPERVKSFYSDVRAEMRKATTPSRKEVEGTTTVVLAGAGGLLLLMQPASNPAAHTALNSTFMSDSCSLGTSHIAKRILRFRHSAWQKRSARGSVVPCPTVRRSSRAHPVDGSADYWIYRAPAAA